MHIGEVVTEARLRRPIGAAGDVSGGSALVPNLERPIVGAVDVMAGLKLEWPAAGVGER